MDVHALSLQSSSSRESKRSAKVAKDVAPNSSQALANIEMVVQQEVNKVRKMCKVCAKSFSSYPFQISNILCC